MERVPEAELMEGAEQAKAYAQADFEEPHSRMIALLRAALPHLPISGCALDLGCGAADIGIRFARAFPGWTVQGLDGSEAMLALGRRAVDEAGLSDRVELFLGRLPWQPPPRKDYDLLFSNALLHHLYDPSTLWIAVKAYSAAGASVFVMDLQRPRDVLEARRLVERYAHGEAEILKRDFYNSFLAAYSVDEVREQLAVAGLPHLSVEPSGDRHLLVYGAI